MKRLNRPISEPTILNDYSELIGTTGMKSYQVKDLDPPIYKSVAEDLGWNPRKIEQLSPSEEAYQESLNDEELTEYEYLVRLSWRAGDFRI